MLLERRGTLTNAAMACVSCDFADSGTTARETAALLEGNQLLLIDDRPPGHLNNPVWCTYGTSPNSASLIRQDGILDTAQLWLDAAEMEEAINNLLK